MYNPHQLKTEYEKLEHGKARESGIREAIRQADENHDVPFQIYFRGILCTESNFYDDSLDMLTVFPELLAIVDKNPDAPATVYTPHENAVADVLWKYKWVLDYCGEFYQIPKADCERFFEDFKRRSVACGYSLRPYHYNLYSFYKKMDDPRMEKEFHLFERTPRDGNADCRACEQDDIVQFYLDRGEFNRAKRLSADLESGVLRCCGIRSSLRVKRHYADYYIENHEYEKAQQLIQSIRKQRREETEFDISTSELLCATYLDIAKALKVYKNNWKKWLAERNPYQAYLTGKDICVFFARLKESRKHKTIKIAYDSSFPLYREDNTYLISELYDFYYQYTADLAEKFDNRNGTDAYQRKLNKALEQAVSLGSGNETGK